MTLEIRQNSLYETFYRLHRYLLYQPLIEKERLVSLMTASQLTCFTSTVFSSMSFDTMLKMEPTGLNDIEWIFLEKIFGECSRDDEKFRGLLTALEAKFKTSIHNPPHPYHNFLA